MPYRPLLVALRGMRRFGLNFQSVFIISDISFEVKFFQERFSMKYLKNIGLPVLFITGYFLVSLVLALFIRNVVVSSMVLDIIYASFCLCIYRRRMILYPSSTKLYISKNSIITLLVVLFVLVFFACQITATWYYVSFGDSGMDTRSEIIGMDKGLYFVLTIVLAPICEETLMRGLVFSDFQKIMPVWLAGIISGFIFGWMHGTAVHMITGTVFGMFMAFIYWLTQDLRVNIALHSLYNLFTTFSKYIALPSFCFTQWFAVLLNAAVLLILTFSYMYINDKGRRVHKELLL